MKMETIADLNQKIWYRGLKILMISVVGLATIGSVAQIFSIVEYPYLNDHTRITCVRADRGGFVPDATDVAKADIFSGENPTGADIKNVGKTYCHLSDDEVEEMIPSFVNNGTLTAGAGCSDRETGLLFCGKYMKLSEGVMVEAKPYGQIALYTVLALLGAIFVIESSRRVFYYLVLGTFVPKKS